MQWNILSRKEKKFSAPSIGVPELKENGAVGLRVVNMPSGARTIIFFVLSRDHSEERKFHVASDGRYLLTGLPPGDYKFQAKAEAEGTNGEWSPLTNGINVPDVNASTDPDPEEDYLKQLKKINLQQQQEAFQLTLMMLSGATGGDQDIPTMKAEYEIISMQNKILQRQRDLQAMRTAMQRQMQQMRESASKQMEAMRKIAQKEQEQSLSSLDLDISDIAGDDKGKDDDKKP